MNMQAIKKNLENACGSTGGVVVMAIIFFLSILFPYLIEYYDKPYKEQCIEARNVLQNAGKDVSNIICGDETSAKARCIQAVDKLRSLNKDVSGIKCESTS